MSKKSELDLLKEGLARHRKEMRDDPAKAKAFLRSVMGPPMRKIDGQEYKDIMLLLKMIEPYKSTNNQHSMTDYYKLGGKEYHSTWFPSLNGQFTTKPELEELLDDEVS